MHPTPVIKQAVEGFCPGGVGPDGRRQSRFDDFQNATLKPDQTISIECVGGVPKDGPLVLTFDDLENPWTAPTPNTLIIP
jgi:hypothetical protein